MSNWVKRGVVSFAVATAKVEQDSLSQSDEGVGNDNGVVRPYYKNQLMSDLKEGRLTQEVKKFREHHYKLLRESEKFKVVWSDGGFEMLKENDVKGMKNAKGDPYDKYPVEVTVDNKSMNKSVYDTDYTYVRTVKTQRGTLSKNKIEEHSELVLVRDIDGKNKLIEFYIPTYTQDRGIVSEIRNLSSNPRVTDFININKLYFTTPGGNPLEFEYKMLAFDKIVEWNGNYIVKMFAECTKNGIWAAEKYLLD